MEHLPTLKTRTILQNIDMCEAWMLNRFFYLRSESLKVFTFCSLGERRTRTFRESDRIKWRNLTSLRSRLRLRTDRSRRTCLTRRESIIFIITDDIDDIDISPTRMEKMPEPNPVSISISSNRNDRQSRIRELHPRRKRNRSSMKCLRRISIDILR